MEKTLTDRLWGLLEHKLISLKVDKGEEWSLCPSMHSIFWNNEIGIKCFFVKI